jgi:hypothetical protein
MHHDEDGGATACVCPGGLLSTSHRVACGRAQVPRRRYAASKGPQTILPHCSAARRRLALPRLASVAASTTQRLTSRTASFTWPGNAQFARLSNEKRKKHLHHAAPRSEPAWRHLPSQFRCPLHPPPSGDGSAHHRRGTHRARRPLLSSQHCANSRARDASSTPALPSRAWRVAPMLLGTDGCVCDGSASTKIVSSIYLRTVICPRATALR